MNDPKLSSRLAQLGYRALLGAQRLGARRRCDVFGNHCDDVIQHIYVINLDREGRRWRQMRRELTRLQQADGRTLISLARRFSATDARHAVDLADAELDHQYSLTDHLFVDPKPLPHGRYTADSIHIEMTNQEAAVARSHIAVWKLVAEASSLYTLILEDDVYFRRAFAKTCARAWAGLDGRHQPLFDLLYLSYEEALEGAEMAEASADLLRPSRGIWQLSGYVLSKRGAQRLLSLLPVRGPVDLWINLQFGKLDVLATRTPLIRQRLDYSSSNSYSVLPVLSKIGVLTRERPPTINVKHLPTPVIAVGDPGSGLTSLATALSMLGYRCLSDVGELPRGERSALLEGSARRLFDAYVNVGSLTPEVIRRVAAVCPGARLVVTTLGGTLGPHQLGPATSVAADAAAADGRAVTGPVSQEFLRALDGQMDHVLVLPAHQDDKWQLISTFLGCEYPSHRYPDGADTGQRVLRREQLDGEGPHSQSQPLKWDVLPWILDQVGWNGLLLEHPHSDTASAPPVHASCDKFDDLDESVWHLRDDTFPDNLALFSPSNFSPADGNGRLTLREEDVVVREFTSAALSSSRSYRYGRFTAELKPARALGVVTGMFLHRNSPRQEIDIEFVGNDTTKMLVNVYYNPGPDGAKLEYGYRGTPVAIDLGFDAASDFHRYEIDWTPTAIRWAVDGRIAHERAHWNPTPIPHLSMQFHVNLWPTRSAPLAGRLSRRELPAWADVRRLEVRASA